MDQIHNNAPKGIPVLLVGNKKDLAGHRQIGEDRGRELAQKVGAEFREVSALAGDGVVESMETMGRLVLRDMQERGEMGPLGKSLTPQSRGRCCKN
jgi:GTPase SAR1 family protein